MNTDFGHSLKNIQSKNRVEHRYSEKVRIVSNLYTQTLLAKLCQEKTKLPELNLIIESLYRTMLSEAIHDLMPAKEEKIETRMSKYHQEAKFKLDVAREETPCVVVDLARAGTFPSHICFNELNILKNCDHNRQDHFYINRKVNKKNEVIGVDVSGSKIGGGQEGAMVFFPDPMGATGGSLSHCISHYKTKVKGKALCYIALHIIITPEYIQKMSADHPDAYIYALRLDRGLSSKKVLQSIPGTYPKEEKGLNKNQYIVPGAGGVGELLNNSFV